MIKASLINDVDKYEIDDFGYPIIFQNPEIRKMFSFANAGKNDIFYDLGCGWGQNLIIAKKEFNVKKAVGIEKLDDRYLKAKKRLKKWKIPETEGIVIKDDFNNIFNGKNDEVDISEATIVFYGLGTDEPLANDLSQKLSKGCRLIYYYNCLFPEFLPDKIDFPFYLSIQPFTKPKNTLEWLRKIVPKNQSSISKGKLPSEEELWNELKHDYNIDGDCSSIRDYKTRLKKS